MSRYPRYAIYFVPAPECDLYRLGARALGYDAFSGDVLPFPESLVRAAPDWPALTGDPRKYGFHATLKAPLGLADNRTEAELIVACEAFASMARPIPVIAPAIRAVGFGAGNRFIALVPTEPSAGLGRLAQECVAAFDTFRAPLTEQDRARRHPERLTASQVANLDRWGYPYVGDDFRFHMTLTGAVPAERCDALMATLRDYFADHGQNPLVIDRIALCRQDDTAARFRIHKLYVLQAGS